ncbi:MAG: YicC family protein [SAR86 cluster bacterium]|uniref:YicC family protein n=1 Tax=SAR86 cluster bacterium TaxID=2030880 RepID=A0A2A4MT13_9GAMM|nr:MAG: YicC family protein [SAR86 cluster bacterium]
MILSMTAFSRQQLEESWGSLTWEVRSVNHRYLEANIKLPESLRGLETAVRNSLRKQLNRGKLDCQLRFRASEEQSDSVHIDQDLVQKLVNAGAAIKAISSSAAPMTSMEILNWPGVLKTAKADMVAIEKQALQLFETTLEDLIATRSREGNELKAFVEQRNLAIQKIVSNVREKMPLILQKQKQNILLKVEALQIDLDPTRLEQEIALLAQKADVDEELDRLDSHLREVERVLSTKGQKGRRLDFLMQELNREANTLSSKSIVAETTLDAVELKVLIEQMREQIQNIE